MNVFIRAIVRTFSIGERLIVPFNLAIASLNGTINLSPHENILTFALINIHYLYIIAETLFIYYLYKFIYIMSLFLYNVRILLSIRKTRPLSH